MKVVFVSNYINHHQIPFCNAMREQLSEDFFFVQTEPMAEERIKMGWGQDFSRLPYLHLFYEEEFFCRKLIAESDIVLFGGVDDESYIADRLREGKIVVRLSERLYKPVSGKPYPPGDWCRNTRTIPVTARRRCTCSAAAATWRAIFIL